MEMRRLINTNFHPPLGSANNQRKRQVLRIPVRLQCWRISPLLLAFGEVDKVALTQSVGKSAGSIIFIYTILSSSFLNFGFKECDTFLAGIKTGLAFGFISIRYVCERQPISPVNRIFVPVNCNCVCKKLLFFIV